VDCLEIGRDGRNRLCVRLESEELWMVAISLCFAAQNFLRQQRLAPQGDQSFSIKIFRVQGPQAHREI
jgi:hypothetical protein